MGEPLDIFGRPLEERRLLVCVGPCCDREGRASATLAALRRLLAETGLREASIGAASCVRRHCLGNCGAAPLAQVLPDDVWHCNLSAQDLLHVYERQVLRRRRKRVRDDAES
jgi:NADH:ubiquinone oxidoreductase subunit E